MEPPHEVPLINFDSEEDDPFSFSSSLRDFQSIPVNTVKAPFDAFEYSYVSSSSSVKQGGLNSAENRSTGFESETSSINDLFSDFSLSHEVSSVPSRAQQQWDDFHIHSSREGNPSIFYDGQWNERHFGLSTSSDGGDSHAKNHDSRLDANASEDKDYRGTLDPSSYENVIEDRGSRESYGLRLNEDINFKNSWSNENLIGDKDSRETQDWWFDENVAVVKDTRKTHDLEFKEEVQSETSPVSASSSYVDFLSSDEIYANDVQSFAESSTFSPQTPPCQQGFVSTSLWSASTSHHTDANSKFAIGKFNPSSNPRGS